MKQIARFMEGKKVRPGKSSGCARLARVKDKAKESVKQIEKSGGHVLAGVCTIVSWTEKLGIRTIMTNSAKDRLLRANTEQSRDNTCTTKRMHENRHPKDKLYSNEETICMSAPGYRAPVV